MFQTAYALTIAACSRSSPLPVSADTITIGAPRSCGSSRPNASRSSLSFCGFSSSRSHLLTATTTARPSRSARSAIRRSWLSNGICTSRSTTTTSANFTARRPSETDELLELLLDLGLLPHARRCRRSGTRAPSSRVSTAIASRVIPASGPVSSRSSPRMRVDERRLAGVRPPDDGDLDRPARRQRRPLARLVDAVVDLLGDLDDLDRVGKALGHRLERRAGGRPCRCRARPRAPPARRGRARRPRSAPPPPRAPRPCWRRGSPAPPACAAARRGSGRPASPRRGRRS